LQEHEPREIRVRLVGVDDRTGEDRKRLACRLRVIERHVELEVGGDHAVMRRDAERAIGFLLAFK
jgi:hypothetical protein